MSYKFLTKKSNFIGLIALAAFLSFSTLSSANEGYIGVGVNTGSGEHSYGGDFYGDINVDTSSINFKIGTAFPNQNKAELDIGFYNVDPGSNSASIFNLDIDYYFVWGESSIKPYLMLGFGLPMWTNYNSPIDGKSDTLVGFSFNLGGGVFYKVNNNIELEAGLKIKGISWIDETHTCVSYGRFFDIYSTCTLEQTTSMSNFSLAARYKF